MNRDLTVGKPSTVLWKFCLPLFASVIFQQLYNIADSLIAGKFIGEAALAAVGNGYEITLIFLAFGFGCNIGCSVVVSRLFGAKQYRDMKTAVSTTFVSTAILCGFLMLIGQLLCGQLLSAIHTPDEIFADSALYLRIYIWGLPFLFFYNVSNGIFSALGDSRTPFLFLAASSLSNIGMDVLFVKAFGMGVAGVAWATFLCQGVSCVLAVFFVLRRLSKIPAEGRLVLFSFPIFRQIARIAVPSILQQSFVSVGNIFIQGIINPFGTGVVAGYAASIKLNNLVITSLVTVGNGVSNYTAQNLGANKPERVREGFHAGWRMMWVLAIPIVFLYLFAGKYLVGFFLNDPSDDALRVGLEILRILSPFYLITAFKFVSDGVLRGSGNMTAFMISTLVDLILRVVLAKILSVPLGTLGIWLAWPIGWVIAVILSVTFYKTTKWSVKPAEQAREHSANA